MSNGKKQVKPNLDSQEFERLRDFKQANGYDSWANAGRKALMRGIGDWERAHDPAQSWLLNIGVASMLWALMAVVGYFSVGVSWIIPAASVVIALVFLTAHAVQIARQRWSLRTPASAEVRQ